MQTPNIAQNVTHFPAHDMHMSSAAAFKTDAKAATIMLQKHSVLQLNNRIKVNNMLHYSSHAYVRYCQCCCKKLSLVTLPHFWYNSRLLKNKELKTL